MCASSVSISYQWKVVKYPLRDGKGQGVGPHYDSGFLTLVMLNICLRRNLTRLQLLQASDHKGLQAQNPSGEWIDVPPIEDTLVINVGKGNIPSSMGEEIV